MDHEQNANGNVTFFVSINKVKKRNCCLLSVGKMGDEDVSKRAAEILEESNSLRKRNKIVRFYSMFNTESW